jgi:hypothetical protein
LCEYFVLCNFHTSKATQTKDQAIEMDIQDINFPPRDILFLLCEQTCSLFLTCFANNAKVQKSWKVQLLSILMSSFGQRASVTFKKMQPCSISKFNRNSGSKLTLNSTHSGFTHY